MNNSVLMDPIKQVLHFAVDYAVPRNTYVAIASGVVGWWTPLAVQWHGGDKVKNKWIDTFGDNIFTFIFGPAVGQTGINKAAEYTGVYAAIATSITLNLIAQFIFKAKREEGAHLKQGLKANLVEAGLWRRPVNQDDLRAISVKSPSAPPRKETIPVIMEQPIDIKGHEKGHEILQEKPMTVAPKTVEQPSYESLAQKQIDDLQEMLEELETPCCGQILSIFKKVWGNDKPDSVYRRQNAGMQSFI